MGLGLWVAVAGRRWTVVSGEPVRRGNKKSRRAEGEDRREEAVRHDCRLHEVLGKEKRRAGKQ